MAEIRYNNQQGVLGADPGPSGTTITFAVAPDFATLTAGQTITLALDAGLPTFEIVYLTAYTAGSTTGTITRAAEDGTKWPAVAHPIAAGPPQTGTWANSPTVNDFSSGSTPVGLNPTNYNAGDTISGTGQLALVNTAGVITLPAAPADTGTLAILNNLTASNTITVSANSGQQIADIGGGSSGSIALPVTGSVVTLTYSSSNGYWYQSQNPDYTLAGDVTGTLSTSVLKNTGPGATGPIGDGTHVPVVTIDAKGRVTALTSQAISAGGSGTVTSASVVSANGLAGTVANPTTTPAITLSTSVTGVLKGNGTAISAATSGTDYAPATSGSSVLKGNGSGGFSAATGTDIPNIAESQVTNLTTDLAAKAPVASPTFTGTVTVPSGAALGTPASVNLTNGTALPESGVTNLTTDLAAKAPLASPTFTGTPAAPTPTTGDNTTKIATTAFVNTATGGGSGPGAPGIPAIGTAVAGNSQVTVNWTAPTTNGGSPVTGYIITPYIGTVSSPTITVGNVTTYVVTGLVNGTTYTFRVAAVNANGTGPRSVSSNTVTPAGSTLTPSDPSANTTTQNLLTFLKGMPNRGKVLYSQQMGASYQNAPYQIGYYYEIADIYTGFTETDAGGSVTVPASNKYPAIINYDLSFAYSASSPGYNTLVPNNPGTTGSPRIPNASWAYNGTQNGYGVAGSLDGAVSQWGAGSLISLTYHFDNPLTGGDYYNLGNQSGLAGSSTTTGGTQTTAAIGTSFTGTLNCSGGTAWSGGSGGGIASVPKVATAVAMTSPGATTLNATLGVYQATFTAPSLTNIAVGDTVTGAGITGTVHVSSINTSTNVVTLTAWNSPSVTGSIGTLTASNYTFSGNVLIGFHSTSGQSLTNASVLAGAGSIANGSAVRVAQCGDMISSFFSDPTSQAYTNFGLELAQITAFCQAVGNAGGSVIYRLFHEMNGDWFWWCQGGGSGGSGTGAPWLAAAWRFVQNYLQNVGVHNVLYAWGPIYSNGSVTYPAADMTSYPGDAYVDIAGVDSYGVDPNTGWMQASQAAIASARSWTTATQKPFAVFEFGWTNSFNTGVPGSGNATIYNSGSNPTGLFYKSDNTHITTGFGMSTAGTTSCGPAYFMSWGQVWGIRFQNNLVPFLTATTTATRADLALYNWNSGGGGGGGGGVTTSGTNVLKGDGLGGITSATPGTDYLQPLTGDVTTSGAVATVVPQQAIARGQDVTSRGGAAGSGSVFTGVPYRTTVASGSNGVSLTTLAGGTALNVAATIGNGTYFAGKTTADAIKYITVVTSGGSAVLSYTGTTATTYTGIAIVSGTGAWTVATGNNVTHQANIVPDVFMGASITRGDGGVLGSTDWATLLNNTENNLAGLIPQNTGFVFPVYTDGATYGGLQWNVSSGSGITQVETGAPAPGMTFKVTAATAASPTVLTVTDPLGGAHNIVDQQTITLSGITTSGTSLTGTFTATYVDSTHLSVAVNSVGATISFSNAYCVALYASSIKVAYNSATTPSDNRTFRRVLLFYKNQTNGDKVTFATTGVVVTSPQISTNSGTGYGVWDSGDLGYSGAGTGWTATPATNGTGSHDGVVLIGALYIQSAGTSGSVNFNISKGGSSTVGWSTYTTNWSAFLTFLTTIGFTPRRAFLGDQIGNDSLWGVGAISASTGQTNLQNILKTVQTSTSLTEPVLFSIWNLGTTGNGVGEYAWANTWVPAIRNAAINVGATFVDGHARFGDFYQNRTVTDGVANGTTTLTSATASFTSPADVGTYITGALIPNGTTITAVNSATSVTMSAAATGSGSSQTIVIGGDRWGLSQDNLHAGTNLTSKSGRNGQQAFAELFFEKLEYSQSFAISGQVLSGAPGDGAIKTLIASTLVGGTSVGLYTNSADTQPAAQLSNLPGFFNGIAFGPGGSTAADSSVQRSAVGVLTLSGPNAAGGSLVKKVAATTVSSNAGTVPVNVDNATFTNSSAATMTITLTTSGAVDGQTKIVRIYDFSAAAQTISWVNTENSQVTVPTTSNGSTTLPLTVGFVYNGSTSKWRCVAVA